MSETAAARQVILEVRGLTKFFAGIPALYGVDLKVHSGEVHAIVGANGSGKSTFVKILSGYHEASSGSVVTEATTDGDNGPVVAFVHQDLGLVESMSVLENVALTCGYTTSQIGRIRWKAMHREVRALLAEFGLEDLSNSIVSSLGATERRLVAIARAAHSMGIGRGVLVLDEPTAELAAQESKRAFEIISNLTKRGAGVIFIAHNLTDVMQVAETVTVLRDGRVVACVKSKSSSVEQLAGFMFGSSTELILDSSKEKERVSPSSVPSAVEPSGSTPAIRLSGISASRLKDVNVDVWPGEIVGVTGLIGCGKSEMGRVVAGAQVPHSGTLSVFGVPMTRYSPDVALAAGVAYVPSDRRRFGGVLPMDARENVTLTTVNSFFRGGWLHKRRELESVAQQMVEVGAVPSNPRQIFETFSGGNQQKLVFARALRRSPRVVVLDEPTHGVDVSTIPELYRMVREMAQRGCGVLLITSDLDELVALSDRVIVLSDGRCTDELSGNDISVERIGLVVSRGHSKEIVE